MHLADGFGVPLVVMFSFDLTAPDRPALTEQHCLRHQVECSPCFLRECRWTFAACAPSLLKKQPKPFSLS